MQLPNPLDALMRRTGIKVEDLNEEEALYYQRAGEAVNQTPPTIAEQVNLIDDHIEDLVLQLCNVETTGKNSFLDAKLKARIQNLYEMRAMLTPGEKAQRYYEKLSKLQER